MMRELMKYTGIAVAMVTVMIFSGHAQYGPPPVDENQDYAVTVAPAVIEEPPPEVLIDIDGKQKRASELTEDETLEFLQEKIKTINHEEGTVELLHIAPGYPLVMVFEEVITQVFIGDPKVARVQVKGGKEKNGKILLIQATSRIEDNQPDIPNTILHVLFPGNKLRVYHIFVERDLVKADTNIHVVSFGTRPSEHSFGIDGRGNADIRTITQVIRNYDALKREKGINSRFVKRFEVFRRSKITSFTTFYLYRFASSPVAVSFAYQNPYPYPIRYDESRLRLSLGNMQYIPDYVSFHKTTLQPGETTTGFAVVSRPAFVLGPETDFELVWK